MRGVLPSGVAHHGASATLGSGSVFGVEGTSELAANARYHPTFGSGRADLLR